MVTEHDKAHMREILNRNYGDWFSAHLYRLIGKADSTNLEKLRSAYPDHVAAYERWVETGQC